MCISRESLDNDESTMFIILYQCTCVLNSSTRTLTNTRKQSSQGLLSITSAAFTVVAFTVVAFAVAALTVAALIVAASTVAAY